MKRLRDYIYESINNSIFESYFENSDYYKHDFNYVVNVLNDIKNNNVIILGNKNVGPFKYLKINPSNNLIDKINDLLSDISSSSPQDFNNLFDNIYTFEIYDDVNLKNKSQYQSIHNLWKNIFKGIYSGKNSSGASYGETFESLVCYLYNYGEKNNYSQDLIDNWVNFTNVNTKDNSYMSWIKSSELSADMLKQKFGNDYIAYHIDGINLFDNSSDDKYLNISKIFYGKTGIKSVLGDNKYDNIYIGNKKDKWNPADIVLINKELDEDDCIKDFLICADGTALNNKLVEYTLDMKILPVSLKKITNTGKIWTHNINSNEEYIDSYKITDVNIILGKKYEENSLTGNFVIDGENAQIQIRKQSSGDNLSIEAKFTNSNTRAGKGIYIVKKDLGLEDDKNNSYYAVLNDNSEILDFFNKNNFNINLSDEEFKELSNKYPDLYERTCYRGFIGLYGEWFKKYKDVITDHSDLSIQFIKYLWECCTKCPGAYYIIM